jgi:hypothetical protein
VPFSLKKFLLGVKKYNNLYLRLVMPSSGWKSPIVMFMCCTKWSSVINLDLFWKQVFSYCLFILINLLPRRTRYIIYFLIFWFCYWFFLIMKISYHSCIAKLLKGLLLCMHFGSKIYWIEFNSIQFNSIACP